MAPDVGEVLSGWRLFPVGSALVALGVAASIAYGWLVVRRGGWPWPRVLSWCAAAAVVAVALVGPVGVYGEKLFWVHMVQHLALIMVVPVLVVWAQPIRLLHGDDPPGGSVARLLTSPMPALALYAAVVVLTHLTGFQQVALTEPALRGAEVVLYLVTGYLLFLPLVGGEAGPRSGPRALPHLFRFVVLVLAMGVDTLTGVVLMLTSHPLAPGYAAAHAGWGPSALADQNVAGAVMWWGGDALMMALLIVVGVQWGVAPTAEQGLGTWIEGARRRHLLGASVADDAADVDDEAARRAYNERLAALHRADGERGGR